MERAIDKCILCICTVYVLGQSMFGTTRIVSVYLTLAAAAALIWLLPADPAGQKMGRGGNIRLTTAFILMDVAAALVLFNADFFWLLPLLVYDMLYGRNWPGLIISGLAYVNAIILSVNKGNPEGLLLGITSVLIFLAVWLAAKTIRLAEAQRQVKKMRDDDEEQRQQLNRQNEQLLEARDSEVVTAQLAERNRIAREIHDNVGHTLSRALLQVGALLAIHKEEPVHTELTGVRETLDSAMTSIRSSVHDLHDSSVNLEGTVRQIAEPLQTAFHVSIEIDASEDMPREKKYGIIGILREAVSNILRHSLNDSVLISILEHPGFYQLVVHDYLSSDGTLRNEPVTGRESSGSGIGVTNMESRARSLGGTVRITEDSGYRVFVSIPK